MTSYPRELHHGFLFPRELQYSLIDPILDNIPETPTGISTMIPGVVILTINFSFKLFFVGELVILRKRDELLLQKELLNLCHIRCISGLCIRGM